MCISFFRNLLIRSLKWAASSKSNFSITEIKFFGDKNIAKKIDNNLKIYKNEKNKSVFYDLEIYINENKSTLTKDEKGNPELLSINISVDLIVFENKAVKSKKKFNQSFIYKNSPNKFNLKKYEKTIERNLIDEILSKIILHLYSLQ